MKKQMLFTVAAITILGGGILTATHVSAETALEGSSPMNAMVEKIATRFGLNQDEVQAVFDEQHEEFQAERATEYLARLDELVAAGTITDAQKQLLVAKHSELQEKRESQRGQMHDLSPEERRATMEAERQSLQDWATQNDIDLESVMFGEGRGRGQGPGRGMDGEGRGPRAFETATE